MDFLQNALSVIQQSAQNNLTKSLCQTNKTSEKYGLTLSEKDIQTLCECRNNVVRNEKRVEFKSSAVPLIIEKFCASTYITQENYAETIEALIPVFFAAKSECEGKLTDGELIDIMFYTFEKRCGGDIEFLESRVVDGVCRAVRLSEQYDDPDSRDYDKDSYSDSGIDESGETND